jgi:hypothetical protein
VLLCATQYVAYYSTTVTAKRFAKPSQAEPYLTYTNSIYLADYPRSLPSLSPMLRFPQLSRLRTLATCEHGVSTACAGPFPWNYPIMNELREVAGLTANL